MMVTSKMVLDLFLLIIIAIESTVCVLEPFIDYTDTKDDIILLTPNEKFLKNGTEEFQIFCYTSTPKSVLEIWRSAHLMLDNVPHSHKIFPGINKSEVKTMYAKQSMWNPSTWFSGQRSYVDFPAFSEFCVGIDTREKYAIILQVRTVNYWRVLQTILGVMLFLCAPSLSRNPFFHYTSAVSLGVVGSLLILIFVISRFFPKKSTSYAVLIFGYSFVLYILQITWKSLHDIVANYTDILLGYCFCAGFVSFIVCYRMGPIQNIRTFNIIQWSMQILAVFLIYLSSEYREVSTAIILVLFTGQIIPRSWIVKLQQMWYRFFPPKVRLMTELEYIEEGHIETRKALENLRNFCSSPECNAWKTVSRLKNPTRFAVFMESGTHCTDQELLQYNSESYDAYDDDDETADSGDELHENRYPMSLSNGVSNRRR